MGAVPSEPKSDAAKARIIVANERVFIAGKTGSGKTTLAETLCNPLRRMVVLDSKGSLTKWRGLEQWDDPDVQARFEDGENVRMHAMSPLDVDISPTDYWNSVFARCLEVGDVTIYVDELFAVAPPGQYSRNALQACYTRGRELGIGVWASTQRPSWIPLFAMSEAEHYFMFRIMLENDRKRLSAFMGPAVMEPIQDVHGFYYMRTLDDAPEYIRELDLGDHSESAKPKKEAVKKQEYNQQDLDPKKSSGGKK